MKFDFSKYDKKWRWFAVDSDGKGYIYTHKPELKKYSSWQVIEGDYFEVNKFSDADWKNSLQEREETEMEKLVSVFEMEEGKEYVYKCGAHTKYRVVNGLLQYLSEHNGWTGADINYNVAVKMMFKEIKKPARIPDETTPIDTRVRVKSSPDNPWEKRYFAFYNPNSHKKYFAFNCGSKSSGAHFASSWLYCEIIEEGDN